MQLLRELIILFRLPFLGNMIFLSFGLKDVEPNIENGNMRNRKLVNLGVIVDCKMWDILHNTKIISPQVFCHKI